MKTARSAEAARVVITLTQRDYIPPTIREIGKEMGLHSPSTIYRHLMSAVEQGLIRHVPGSRAFRPLAGP